MQKKSLRIIYFQNRNAHTSSPLFRELNILKLPDKITQEKCLFINKYFNKCLPTIFENWFSLSSDFHTYNTRWSNLGCIVVPPHNTKLYGRSSVNISTVYIWNYLQKLNENNLFVNTTNCNSIDCHTCNIRQSNCRLYAIYLTHVKRYICNELFRS